MSLWIPELRLALADEYGDRPAVAVLATVDRDGVPHGRAVACRRVEDDGSLWFATDARSAKNCHVRHTARAEVVLWLPRRREQFRVSGVVDVLTAADEDPRRLALWRSMSDASRAMFSWPPPGRPRDPDPLAFPQAVPADAEPPEEFELLVLDPERVEHLDLNPHPHRRRRWHAEGEWEEEELNP
jgi:PPOX class probable FMN-dependent enzyme